MIEVEEIHFRDPLIEEEVVLAQPDNFVNGEPFDKPPSISINKILSLRTMNVIFMKIDFAIIER
jgi:hypothetical protein